MTACPASLRAALRRQLATLPEARLGYLFGSGARGRPRPSSDFDVAVLVDDDRAAGSAGINRTMRRLAARLGAVVPAALLHIVVLNAAPPLLRHRVLRDGVLLFERDETERVRFAVRAIRAIRDYQDILPRLDEHTRRRLARLRRSAEGPTTATTLTEATRVTRDGGQRDILAAARRAGLVLGARPAPG